MGLAPYGKPIYEDKIINNLIDIKEDGTFRLNQTYFNYATGLTMTNKNFHDLFGQKPRNSKRSTNSVSYGYCSFYTKSH
jgi:carbamoyltransferase